MGVDSDTKFKSPGVDLVPISYRFLPLLLQNTYLGPGIGTSASGLNYFLNLSLGF
jgi:hypothetical protein